MAFFGFLSSIGDLLNAGIGKFIKPIGGQGTNDIFPSPRAGFPQNPGASNAGAVVLDADGALRTRASILTTRQNFRDDFSGASLSTALAGTLTFTAGSVTVAGTGTTFTSQITRDLYIKLNSDAETAWTKVRRVVSDTSLELEQGYLGTTGGPAASSSTKWPTRTGAGGSFTVGSSLANVLSGITNGSRTFIFRDLDFSLLHVEFVALSITQRLATQTGFAGLFDNPASPIQQAAFIFDGIVNTVVRCRSSFSAAAADTQETVVTLPFGLTTNLATITYAVDVTKDRVIYTIAGAVVAVHVFHTPEQWILMDAAVGIVNTGVPTTTTVSTDTILLRAFDQVDSGPNTSEDEQHTITGQLTTTATTADQIIVSYTVPANRTFYFIGWLISVDGNTDGVPIKIGKNTITTPPAAPGTVDSNLFRVFRLDRSGVAQDVINQDYSTPRKFGFAGDVIKVSVTPGGTGSTIWRASFDFILRPS